MIRIKTLVVEEFRGIRKLSLDLNQKNFGICGPNGTGKSGVVDAIEFCLTGNITRLSGAGQGDLSVKGHGPHVDKRDTPDEATVTITAHVPSLNKGVTVTRSVKNPSKVSIKPADAAIKAIIGELKSHPEFALSRREIAKYIITPPSQRAADVQNLLRLDQLEGFRKGFVRFANKCKSEAEEANRNRNNAESELKTALGLETLDRDKVLEKANEKRSTLGLDALTELKPRTSFKEGIDDESAKKQESRLPKAAALADMKALEDVIVAGEPESLTTSRTAASSSLTTLKEDSSALSLAKAHGFIQAGLGLVDDDSCPLCDTSWDADELRAHLNQKLLTSKEMGDLLTKLGQSNGTVIGEIDARTSTIKKIAVYAKALDPPLPHDQLAGYVTELEDAKEALKAFEKDHSKIDDALTAIDKEWWSLPDPASQQLNATKAGVQALPDGSAKDKAIQDLAVLQDRYDRLILTSKRAKHLASRNDVAQRASEHYVAAQNKVLEEIYDAVAKDFTKYYKAINDDEGGFKGELKAEPAKLSFNVDFYGRGTFPPGAYHSEGHQDGMGLCLYLALMKHTLGDKFTFAVLDDVLMSVDTGHRREVCRLLKTEFPNTQFILTTHDRVWLQFMKTEKLIANSQFFGGWHVDTGPRIWNDSDIWTEVDAALKKDDVPKAAALLRRYLEYISSFLADNFRASVEYRGDANYDLGDLLPPVMKQWRDRINKGIKAAKNWGHTDEQNRLQAMHDKVSELIQKSNAEQWAINKSVHFNAWENFTASEFRAVSSAFKDLLDYMRCSNSKCDSYPYLTPRKGTSEQLKCPCGNININLKAKA